ncbi:50S ribosomal protein L29 [Candidatus Gottesmanbacteria bacterium]|nr:50S ribosomal protein L29 [Candidatus Gottesmanbacteria bacterium]
MKPKVKNEFRDKTVEELRNLLKEYETDITMISISQKSGKMKNVSLLGKKRNEVARIITIMKEKELERV